MRTQQALVAVGGKASRLKEGGVEVPISKSFLRIADRPMLAWCLQSLGDAGVRRLILAGDFGESLEQSEKVVGVLPHKFEEIRYFQDPGLGVHGLPFHARHLLEDTFFFECGHNVNKPGHYQQMDCIKSEANVVFSAFAPPC